MILFQERSLASVAVDVHAIMCARGVLVRERCDVENSGSIYWSDQEEKWIVDLRAQESWVRKRYTLAHELGHYVLHLGNGARKDLSPLHRTENPSTDRMEREANQYAAELLMPAGRIRNLYRNGTPLDELAAMFQVSKAAMGWRLHNLGLERIG